MKKNSIIIFVVSVIYFLFSFSCSEKKLKVEEIWDKYINTIGDIQKIRNLKSYKSIINVRFKGETYESFFFYKANDKNLIINNNSDSNRTICNKDSIAIISKHKKKFLTGKEAELWKKNSIIFPEIYYKENGCKFELVGEEKINNHDTYKIKVIDQSSVKYYFIDKSSFLCIKFIFLADGGTYHDEFHMVDGINCIFKWRTIVKNDTFFYEKKLMEFNVDLNDTLFYIK